MKNFILTAALCLATAIAPVGTASAASRTYVALGDSVAAGAGLPVSADSTTPDQLCGRSDSAYPYHLANSLQLPLLHLACSGAKADEGVYGTQKIGDSSIPEQLDAAFIGGTPEVISLTVGANDVRWTQFIRQCLSTINCNNRSTTAVSSTLLTDLRAELNWIMFRIHHMSDGDPPLVLLNGYYSPYHDTSCSDAASLTSSEQRWIDQRVNRLNNAIKTIAGRYSFAHYVNTDFSGHGLCSDSSWVQGLQDSAPFHPTASGQQAIAEANFEVYEQLTSRQPQAEPLSIREKLLDIFGRIRS